VTLRRKVIKAVRGPGLYVIASKVPERAERASFDLALSLSEDPWKTLFIECCYELSRYLKGAEAPLDRIYAIEVKDYYTNFILVNALERFIENNKLKVIVISAIQKTYLKSLTLVTNTLGARIALLEMLAFLSALSKARGLYIIIPMALSGNEEDTLLAKYAKAIIDVDEFLGSDD